MTKRMRLIALIVILNAALLLPAALLPTATFDTAGGLYSLGALAIVFISYARGVRAGLVSSLIVGAAAALAMSASAIPALGVAVMALAALGQGITARHGLQRITIMVPITMAFVVSEPPTSGPLSTPVAFGLVLAAFGCLIALAGGLVDRGTPHAEQRTSMSTSRAAAYGTLLAVTTVATTTIALTNGWGHAGGWLIMTPFIVIQPYVQDGWRKALARAGGTMVGFAIAAALAWLVDSPLVLTIAGFACATVAIYAMVKKWHYALYATFLTPAIVLLESGGRSVTELADKRLEATLLAVGLSLVAMALAIPIYRAQARKLGLDKY
jgi:hypothetical protein